MENQENDQQQSSNSGISFPTVGQEPKSRGGAKTLLIAGILILVGILGFVIFKSASKKSDTITIGTTSEDSLTTPIIDETPTASPSPVASPSGTPKASSRTSVGIEVQNGTGITGEAAYLQTQLKTLGYSKISVGNAANQDATVTNVTFSKSLASDIVDELTKKLQSLYQEVLVKTVTSSSFDVVIVTGIRKGATAAPKSSPTATPKASTAPKTSSPSPTPSKSPTPTP